MKINNEKPFIHLFSTIFGKYFYDVNTNKIIKISDNIYKCLETNQIEDVANLEINRYLITLKQKGYLKSKHVKISEHAINEYYESFLDHNLSQITIQVTQKCNLNCEYCVYSGNYYNRTHSDKIMSYDMAKKAIEYILLHSSNSEHLAISFYGGEPLLAFELIKKCVEFAENEFEGRVIRFNFTTNGTLLTEEKFDFLVRHDFSILISLDGPEEVHDKNRKFANSGKGSFKVMMKNVKRLKELYPDFYNKNVAFNSVMDPSVSLSKICDFTACNEIVKNSRFSSTVVNDIYAKNKTVFSVDFLEKYEYYKFLTFLWKLGRLAEQDIAPLMRQHFSSLRRTGKILEMYSQSELPIKGHRGGPCIPGVRKLFVTTDGWLYPCERVSETSRASRIGHIDTGVDIEKALALLNIEKVTSKDCRNCWAYSYCDMCVAQADDGEKISRDKILSLCDSTRYRVEEQFKDYLVLKELGYDYELDV
ncbi:Cys-rich peptide radical SAM maturase CcpM [Blautia schinkii]|nr:Cys-rich peptide radical SAM maturase CcpM [Blautia schinkii]